MHSQYSSEQIIRQISEDSALLSIFRNFTSQRNLQSNFQIQKSVSNKIYYNESSVQRGYTSQCQNLTIPVLNHYKYKKKIIRNKNDHQIQRRRTKMYIEMLENRVQQLQSKVIKLQEQISHFRQHNKKFSYSQTIINGFFGARQQIYEKLQQWAQSIHPDESKIVELYSALRLKQGACGNDRIKAVNYFFKELTQMFMPDLQKYLLSSAEQSIDIFDEGYFRTGVHERYVQSWSKKFIQQIQLTTQQLKQIHQFKADILEIKNIFDKKLQQFYTMKECLSTYSLQIQNIINRMHKFLCPLKIAKFLCYIEKYRFQKGIYLEGTARLLFEKMDNQKTLYNTNTLFSECN